MKSHPLTDHLLLGPDEEHGIDHDFLLDAISRFPEDESVKDAIVGAVEDMSRRLAQMTMNDDYKPYIGVSILCELSNYDRSNWL